MTQMRNLSTMAILACSVVAGCGVSNPGDPGTGSDFSGSGSGGSGDGSGSGSGSGTGMDPGDPDVNVTPTYPTQHPKIYLTKNAARLKASLTANGPAAARFKSVVDSWVNGADLWGFAAWNSSLMGQLTGDPKYCAKSVAIVEAQVTAAEAAIAAGTQPTVANDSYLDVGGMIGDLALTYDWCFDNLSSAQKTRWLAYANQAVSNVWNPTTAKWGSHTMPWSGWATNDPSDNYFYSFTRATMLLGLAAHGEDPQADTWLKQFRETKILGELVPTFNADLVGGGSREGTGYGVAMGSLWILYDFWHATTGESLAGKTGHTYASMLSFMHQIVPTDDRVAPTGDLSRDSTAAFFDYHRGYLQELISLYSQTPLAQRAKMILDHSSVPKMGQQFEAWSDFLYEDTSVTDAPVDINTTYYAKGIGELYSRSGWDTHATWINLIAGPYTQSHAHQDQGSLMVYKDGWLGYDAVVDSHSGLTQQTTAHSLVRIDQGGSPIQQVASTISKLVALHKGADWVYSAADLTPAYNGNSSISMVQREVVFLQPNVVVVYDRVNSASGTQQVWQFATPQLPAISGGTTTINGGAHTLKIQRFAPAANATVHNMTAESDYAAGYRLDETMQGGNQRYLHVLSIDGAAQSATSANDSQVTVNLAGGKTATITFNHDAVGATMEYGGTTTTLAAGVDMQAP